MQNALLSSQDYEALFTAVEKSALVSITDATGNIVYANQRFVEVSGYTIEELLGQNHRILKSGEQSADIFTNLWQTISSGRVWRGELKNKNKNGGFYWVDTSISPIINQNGVIERYISVRFLITDRKEVEDQNRKQKTELEQQIAETQKFFLAVESTNEHVVITDVDGIVIYANQGAEKTTGFPREEILGSKAGVLWGGLMPHEFYENLWQTIKVDKKTFKGEVNNMRKGGIPYIAYATISPVLDKDGQILFFVGIERDITQEKDIDRAKTEFVSLASHQLRTPLTSINWYCEMLLNGDYGPLQTEQRKQVEIIAKSSQRMSNLVNALLSVSRIELGTFAIEPEEVDLVDIIKEVIMEEQPMIGQKRHNLKLQFSSEPLLGKVDPKLFSMIVENLLSNAIKYTPDGGELELKMMKSETGYVFAMLDSGLGIPQDQQCQIYNKLFRASNVVSSVPDGTGLGLYIVRSIVESAGGKIRFESNEGAGTKFFVEFPVTGMLPRAGGKRLA